MAWSGAVLSSGASASIDADNRTVSTAMSSPSPALTCSSEDADPSSTALAWAPRSRDSAVSSGDVRRSPRSRSITSIPSRVPA